MKWIRRSSRALVRRGVHNIINTLYSVRAATTAGVPITPLRAREALDVFIVCVCFMRSETKAAVAATVVTAIGSVLL